MLDPLENGLFDIPDYDNIDDEAFPPLPPPGSPGQEDNDADPFANGEEDGEVSKLPDVPKRRGVKRPQPKLDSQRLTSERGLPALRNMFDTVTFKGKGHEADDLRVLMQRMENWAHRLYPKLQFEDFIDKLETLGAKKEVQTCLKRIRLDMPLTHEDFIGHEDEPQNHVPDEPRDRVPDDPFGEGNFPEDPFIHSTPAPTPAPVSLSEEQQRRIELNKQLALERRLARMQQQQQQGASQAEGSGAAEEPSPSTSTSTSTSTPVSQEDVQEQDKEPEEQEKETGSSEHSAAADTSEDKAPPRDSPLFDDEGDSPAPALTNGVVDSSSD